MAFKNRQMYETAFDSKIEKKNSDGADFIDRITNHPLLQILNLRRRSRNHSLFPSDKSHRIRDAQNKRSKFYVSISPPLADKITERRHYGCCHTNRYSSSHGPQRLRPIGLSKSDDEILSRRSISPDEDESLEGYAEGPYTRELSADLLSLHISAQRPFSKAHKEQFVGEKVPQYLNEGRCLCSSMEDFSSAQLPNGAVCSSPSVLPSISRPYSLAHASASLHHPDHPQGDLVRRRLETSSQGQSCEELNAVQIPKPKSHILPRKKNPQILNLQNPPGSDPLPVKFSKKTPCDENFPSSWFTPPPSSCKDAKEVANKETYNNLSQSAKISSNSSSSDLSDSMAVLLDSSSQRNLDEDVLCPPCNKYSSVDSVATGSGLSSLESLRSTVSEGNKSTVSSESAIGSCKGSSLSSGSPHIVKPILNLNHPHRSLIHSAKFQILSPISDKSHEPSLDMAGLSPKTPHELSGDTLDTPNKRATPGHPTKNIQEDFRNVHHIIPDPVKKSDSQAGSDSGIGVECRKRNTDSKDVDFGNNATSNGHISQTLQATLCDLPFDMPKLRRKLALANSTNVTGSSSSLTSSLHCPDPTARLSLPMNALLSGNNSGSPVHPAISKLQQESSSGVSQSSSSNSSDWDIRSSGSGAESSSDQGTPKLLSKMHNRRSLALELGCTAMSVKGKDVDVDIPIAKQMWYHGAISRQAAENLLRHQPEGSYLVRSLDCTKSNYSLSLKSARGFMHLRLRFDSPSGKFRVGRFDLLFPSVPHVVSHFSVYRIPIRGAEHMVLLYPLASETL